MNVALRDRTQLVYIIIIIITITIIIINKVQIKVTLNNTHVNTARLVIRSIVRRRINEWAKVVIALHTRNTSLVYFSF